ncbi:Exocyst complex component 5 [Entomophthora muscae]|uniref:Exocyst complex component 5 n=1 Tax=Entomophthora muscae TaxID=34485 RepID=A0ACC2TC73_9FUNG|nr:Exocyst complex component 5 [Entomophthora muscae]
MRGPAIHGLDRDVSDKLTLEYFYTEVDSKQFIDGLSSSIVAEARNDETNKEFVAKPFIRSFEYALENLQRLRLSVCGRIKELEGTAAEVDAEQAARMKGLTSSFNEVQDAARELEGRIGEVGNTAVQIGQQLETLDRQLQRASQARDLVRYFLEFTQQGHCASLEDLRSMQGPEGQYKAAIIARKLSNLAKELDLPDIEKTRVSIEKYSENLEKDLLETFDQAYTQGDIATMARCSKTLLDFNGGNSCVQTYINQHEFFMSQRKMRESSAELAKTTFEASRSGFSDLNEPPPPPDPWMVKLYGEVRVVVAKEWDVISKVFPNSLLVIRQFLERIFGQSIEYYLEGLLEKAERQSPLAYLRTLASTHSCTANLVADLQQFDRQFIYPVMRRKALTNAKAESSTNGTDFATQDRGCTAVSSTVERCLEDFFAHIRYLDREITFLQAALAGVVDPYIAVKVKPVDPKLVPKRSMFTRLAMATDMITSNSTSPIGSPFASAPPSPSLAPEEPTPPLSTIVISILCIHGEAMGRCAELSPPSDISNHASRLFNVLVDILGERLLDRILQRALSDIQQRESRPLDADEVARTFQTVAAIHQVMELIQNHFQFAVLPLVSASPPDYRELVLKKNSLLANLETLINKMLQIEISSILKCVGQILATQPRTTFKIKDDDVDFAVLSMATETCTRCIEVLRKVLNAAQEHFTNENLTSLVMEIGISLHSLLLDHFKKFTVSLSGGLLLFQDISQYQAMIRDLRVEELTSRFEVLKEIADLLCMPNPASIPSLLRGGTLASLEINAIYPYLRCREDFISADIPRLLGIRPDFTSATPSQATEDSHSSFPTATALHPTTPATTNSGLASTASSSENVLSMHSSPSLNPRR